jgi:hypothetical protein
VKKALLTVDFIAVVSEVRRAFEVIEQKLAGKTGNKPAAGVERESGSRKPRT